MISYLRHWILALQFLNGIIKSKHFTILAICINRLNPHSGFIPLVWILHHFYQRVHLQELLEVLSLIVI